MKQSFVMYTNWMPMIATLPDQTAAELFKAIAAYQMGEEYEIKDPSAVAIFAMIKATFDADAEKYEETCKRRADAGRKGAEKTNRQKSANAETESAKVGKSRQVPNSSRQKSANADDIDMDIDMEMDMDMDMDMDISKDTYSDISRDTYSSERASLADCEAIPLNDGTEWRPTAEEFNEYVRLYPAVDVKQQFASMRGWTLGNPTRKKTAGGIKRFVTSWLSKEQDRSRAAPKPVKTNSFNDFEQRQYDYDALEKKLLARSAT